MKMKSLTLAIHKRNQFHLNSTREVGVFSSILSCLVWSNSTDYKVYATVKEAGFFSEKDHKNEK